MNLLSRFLLIVAFFIIIQVSNQNHLDIKTVRVVDYQYAPYADTDGINVIFRSDIPEDGDYETFLYDQLVNDFISVAKSEKLIPLEKDNMYILDFTLLADDDPLKQPEVEYWQQHPEQGELRGWAVKGERTNPNDYTTEEIIKKSKDLSWMRDPVEQWIDELHTAMQNFTMTDRNLMILVHCHYGKDRTGEISGAYQLKYGRRSWEEVAATNWETANWHITFDNQRALTWYCHHLQYHQNYTHLTCTHENLDEDSIKTPELVGWDKTEEENGFEIAFYSILSVDVALLTIIFVVGIVLLFGVAVIKFRLSRKSAVNNLQNLNDADQDMNYADEI